VLDVHLSLPESCHISHDAPSQWNLVENEMVATRNVSTKIEECSFSVELSVKQATSAHLEIIAYFCRDLEEVCLSGSVIFSLNFVPGESEQKQSLSYKF
jgi:hypothetical protein